MRRVIRTQQPWTRGEVYNDPHVGYLFGDNLLGKGTAGQACIRGLKNAFGIPTKKLPSRTSDAYFTDDEYAANVRAIDEAIARIPEKFQVLVWHSGIGAGLSEMPTRCPKTYAYLIQTLEALTTEIESP